jgi:hypothetical protein
MPIPSCEGDDIAAMHESLQPNSPISLTLADKWRLAKPLLMKYMLPLCELLSVDPLDNKANPICLQSAFIW